MNINIPLEFNIYSNLIILFIIVFCFLFYIIRQVKNINNKLINLENKSNFMDKYIIEFEKYLNTLDHFLNLAYFTLYQSDISVYVGSQIGINESENQKLCEKFIDILYSLMGPNLLKEYYTLFGNEESFLNYCVLFFNNELINKDLKNLEESIVENDNIDEV